MLGSVLARFSCLSRHPSNIPIVELIAAGMQCLELSRIGVPVLNGQLVDAIDVRCALSRPGEIQGLSHAPQHKECDRHRIAGCSQEPYRVQFVQHVRRNRCKACCRAIRVQMPNEGHQAQVNSLDRQADHLVIAGQIVALHFVGNVADNLPDLRYSHLLLVVDLGRRQSPYEVGHCIALRITGQASSNSVDNLPNLTTQLALIVLKPPRVFSHEGNQGLELPQSILLDIGCYLAPIMRILWRILRACALLVQLGRGAARPRPFAEVGPMIARRRVVGALAHAAARSAPARAWRKGITLPDCRTASR